MIDYKLTLAGCECAVAEWNPSGSIVVFALHGWLDNLASFQSLIPFMADIRLVAIDFPGHGHSAHLPPSQAYHFIDGLNLIDDLAAHFEQTQINILGHSMGGAIATLYAASQPQRVARLAQIESLGPLTATPEQTVELLQRSVSQRRLLIDKRKPVYPTFDLALQARAEASDIAQDLIKPIVERALSNVRGGYTWRADPRLRVVSPLRFSEPQLQQILSKISASVLLIEGEQGFIHGDATLEARKGFIQNLRVKTVKGGHHVHLERAKQCGEYIQTFFNEID